MKINIYTQAVPNIPWEEPAKELRAVWRYSGNPVIPRRIAIYYGCADNCTSIAFTSVNRIIPYIQANSL